MKEHKKPDAYKKLDQLGQNLTVCIAKKDMKYKTMKTRDFGCLLEGEINKAKFEDRALQCLAHPYIISMYQCFTTGDGKHRVVSEYCEGKDLK